MFKNKMNDVHRAREHGREMLKTSTGDLPASGKKQDLRARLLAAAKEIIRTKGLSALKARDVAVAAGTALGSLYTVFSDLDDLVLAINLDSFKALDEVMENKLGGETDPARQLALLIDGYLDFARSEPLLWRAMFDHQLPPDVEVPVSHYDALAHLMGRIAGPVGALNPVLDETARMTRARTLFSAFHGIILLSLDQRFTGLSSDSLESELKTMLAMLLRGAKTE